MREKNLISGVHQCPNRITWRKAIQSVLMRSLYRADPPCHNLSMRPGKLGQTSRQVRIYRCTTRSRMARQPRTRGSIMRRGRTGHSMQMCRKVVRGRAGRGCEIWQIHLIGILRKYKSRLSCLRSDMYIIRPLQAFFSLATSASKPPPAPFWPFESACSKLRGAVGREGAIVGRKLASLCRLRSSTRVTLSAHREGRKRRRSRRWDGKESSAVFNHLDGS